MQRISINGVETMHLSITDRSFQYGDGLFETIAYRNGAAQFWNEHIARFKEGAKILGITFPDEDQYCQDVTKLLSYGTDKDCVIKLILTRGNAERGYKPSVASNPTRSVIIGDWPEHATTNTTQGISTCLCQHPVSINPALAGIKHLNRLDNVMARKEWDDEYAEGFLTDGHGHIVEGTMSNIFCVKNNILLTPELKLAGVRGIIRDQIISLAKECDIETQIKSITIDDFTIMDEIFITNSIIGLWPVKDFAKEKYSIGKITRKLMNTLSPRMLEHAKTFI